MGCGKTLGWMDRLNGLVYGVVVVVDRGTHRSCVKQALDVVRVKIVECLKFRRVVGVRKFAGVATWKA